jgi:hypothetical protein
MRGNIGYIGKNGMNDCTVFSYSLSLTSSAPLKGW